jgi:predicted aspartyl protease
MATSGRTSYGSIALWQIQLTWLGLLLLLGTACSFQLSSHNSTRASGKSPSLRRISSPILVEGVRWTDDGRTWSGGVSAAIDSGFDGSLMVHDDHRRSRGSDAGTRSKQLVGTFDTHRVEVVHRATVNVPGFVEAVECEVFVTPRTESGQAVLGVEWLRRQGRVGIRCHESLLVPDAMVPAMSTRGTTVAFAGPKVTLGVKAPNMASYDEARAWLDLQGETGNTDALHALWKAVQAGDPFYLGFETTVRLPIVRVQFREKILHALVDTGYSGDLAVLDAETVAQLRSEPAIEMTVDAYSQSFEIGRLIEAQQLVINKRLFDAVMVDFPARQYLASERYGYNALIGLGLLGRQDICLDFEKGVLWLDEH